MARGIENIVATALVVALVFIAFNAFKPAATATAANLNKLNAVLAPSGR